MRSRPGIRSTALALTGALLLAGSPSAESSPAAGNTAAGSSSATGGKATSSPGTGAASEPPAQQPQATMHVVFDAIQVLLPLSLDAERFRAPENQAEIAARIGILTGAAHALESHASGRDRGFQFLSESLARDVEEIRHRYNYGRLEEARFYVLEATRNCVACHSRLPSNRDFPMASLLLDEVDLKGLSHHERSQLYVATRQFEKALATWEELFASDEVPAAQLDIGGSINDYLAIAIRVEGDYARAGRGLAIIRARDDVPDYLAPKLDAWIAELARFAAAPPDWHGLGAARKLAQRTAEGGDPEEDALRATVSDLVASSLLLRFLDNARDAPDRAGEVAEAYYLLGRVEARSADSFWVPQATHNLELAIRLAPNSPWAEDALQLYEEQLAFGYGGIESEILPVDLWATLSELRQLVAEAGS
jgi:hypothetical protein